MKIRNPQSAIRNPQPPVALTIAGLDPSGGAGIVADIKTFTAFGCFATAAVTSLTFQNTMGVFGAIHQTAESVRSQVLPIANDFHIASVKTGMLPTREIIEEVAKLVKKKKIPSPVVDPVVRSTSGYDLIDDEALRSLIKKLFPLSLIVTPNILEAERITGIEIKNLEDMKRAATLIRKLGAKAVLVKGGHLEENVSTACGSGRVSGKVQNSKQSAIDVLDDNGSVLILKAERIDTTSTHGTGCTLSAAIAACLGRGMSLQDSVITAKKFITKAIRTAPQIGHGSGPINHNVKVLSSIMFF